MTLPFYGNEHSCVVSAPGEEQRAAGEHSSGRWAARRVAALEPAAAACAPRTCGRSGNSWQAKPIQSTRARSRSRR